MSDEGGAGIVVFVIYATVVAIICHARIQGLWRASSTAATVASVSFVATVTAIQGVHALVFVALIFAWFWSFVIAYVTGKIANAFNRPPTSMSRSPEAKAEMDEEAGGDA